MLTVIGGTAGTSGVRGPAIARLGASIATITTIGETGQSNENLHPSRATPIPLIVTVGATGSSYPQPVNVNDAARQRPRRPVRRFSILRFLTLGLILGLHLGAGALFYAIREFSSELPASLDSVLDYRPLQATRLLAADGQVIAEFYLQKRVLLPLDQIPAHVQNAFIAAEDGRFWKHAGFDPIGIGRAAYANWRGTGNRQGASTITQQVARMLMLSNERTLSRKAKEIILSVRVERELPKKEILRIYLNHVYLGHGAYGVGAAAENYFGKEAADLTIAEAAMLAGLPKAPTKFSPYNDWKRARERQAYVLERMHADGYISVAQVEAARAEPIALITSEAPLSRVAAPYAVEHIRKWAEQRFGEELLFGAGLEIQTTIDMKQQLAAEDAVRKGLYALDARLGFRGPEGHLDGAARDAFLEGPARSWGGPGAKLPAAGADLTPDLAVFSVLVDLGNPKDLVRRPMLVDVGPRTVPLAVADAQRVLRWKKRETSARGRKLTRRIAIGDLLPVRLGEEKGRGEVALIAQEPDVQAALVAIQPSTGNVVALVGGFDFGKSQFDRATQAHRQAGSSIKPFIYATALAAGFTELSIVADAPIAVRTASGGIWAPGNYHNEFLGPVTLRTALAYSINTVSVRLVLAIGVEAVISTMRKLGITGTITHAISLALGTADVSLFEMTQAYAGIAAGGRRVHARFVTRVTSGEGDLLFEEPALPPPGEQVIAPGTAYVLLDLMKGVIQHGTGKKARLLRRPTAGKTGTSTGFRDAWFIAFTPDLACGVWVGRDDFTPIGPSATGGTTALPIWLTFMLGAHPPTPVRDFAIPPDVTFVRADSEHGTPALPGAHGAALVPFARGTLPSRFTSGAVGGFGRGLGAGAK
jgi:penicillin-binding protein 1A